MGREQSHFTVPRSTTTPHRHPGTRGRNDFARRSTTATPRKTRLSAPITAFSEILMPSDSSSLTPNGSTLILPDRRSFRLLDRRGADRVVGQANPPGGQRRRHRLAQTRVRSPNSDTPANQAPVSFVHDGELYVCWSAAIRTITSSTVSDSVAGRSRVCQRHEKDSPGRRAEESTLGSDRRPSAPRFELVDGQRR